MPFTCIPGTFHLVGASASGKPTGFEPDGDSIHFKPADPALLDELQARPGGVGYKLSAIGSLNLRLEGIDALEIHYTPSIKGAHKTHQPAALAAAARDTLTGFLGMNPVPYAKPGGTRVKPPVPVDGVEGAILSRQLDVHGRPVSFLFAGDAPAESGASVKLSPVLLRKSLNHKMIVAGQAYPLFYHSLFADLRREYAAATAKARTAKRGMWPKDVSQKGLAAAGLADLEDHGVVFPKLFRRLADYFTANDTGIAEFIDWLQAHPHQNDEVQDPDGNFTHLDNLLVMKRGKLALRYAPEQIVFIAK